MLDPTALPILMKSLEFLYDEYSKLLAERRERRLREEKGAEAEAIKDLPTEALPAPTKAVALEEKIAPTHWDASEAQVKHLTEMLEIHYGNYRHLSKQYAQWTGALVPPVIANGLAHEEKEIEKLTKELQETLAKVYGKDK